MKIKTIVVMPDGVDRMNTISWINYDRSFEIIGTGYSSEDVFDLADSSSVIHAAFIYVRLPTSDGFYAAEYLQRAHKGIMCVMISGSEYDAVYAFNHESFDFMLTPVASVRFDSCLKKIKDAAPTRFKEQNQQSKNIIIKTKGGYKLIPVKQVLYFEYLDRKCYIHQSGQEKIELSGYTIEQIEETFKQFGFFKCYQSFVVQLTKIEEVAADTINKVFYLTMQNTKEKIPVSRQKYNELMQLLYGNAAIVMKT